MKTTRLTSILKISLPLLYAILSLLLFFENKYTAYYEKITVIPHAESGMATLRGAMVDGKWCGVQEIVDGLDQAGTLHEDATLTIVSDREVRVHLPKGEERLLVFNIGPYEGTVDVHRGNSTQKIDLYRETSNEYGEAFALQHILFEDSTKLHQIAICAVFLLIITLSTYNTGAERCGIVRSDTLINENPPIAFLMFFFSLCLAGHDYCNRPAAGYLAADFFFILSGFYLMRNHGGSIMVAESPGKQALCYAKKTYLRLIPYYFFSFFLGYLLMILTWEPDATKSALSDYIYELLMLEASGLSTNLVVSTGWYCSALILAGTLVYFLLARFKNTYLYCIAPFSLFIIFANLSQKLGHLNQWMRFGSFVTSGALRGFAEIGLGCLCYQSYLVLREKNMTHKLVCTTVELFCFSYITYVLWHTGNTRLDFACVFAMAILIVSLSLQNSIWTGLLRHRAFCYLGTISIGIYLNHAALLRIDWMRVGEHFTLSANFSFLAYLSCTLVLSAVSTRFINNVLTVLNGKKAEPKPLAE